MNPVQVVGITYPTGKTVKHLAIETYQAVREASRMPSGWVGTPPPTVVPVTLCGTPLPSIPGEQQPSLDELYRASVCEECASVVRELHGRLAAEVRLQAAAAVVAAFDQFIEAGNTAVLVEALATLAGLVNPGDLNPRELADLHDLMALADAADKEAPAP